MDSQNHLNLVARPSKASKSEISNLIGENRDTTKERSVFDSPPEPATMALVLGAGALLAASPEASTVLRQNVTSPKGTTEAALQVLMAADAWPKEVDAAIAAATVRSRELAG